MALSAYSLKTTKRLVELARLVAVNKGHENLVNGLPPFTVLRDTYDAHIEAFREAKATKRASYHYYEAADVLYYAACMDITATMLHRKHYFYAEALRFIADNGLVARDAERGAVAKYEWRVAHPDVKDEATEIEVMHRTIQGF